MVTRFLKSDKSEHTEYFVLIEGSYKPDGTQDRISMDAETFARTGFVAGQSVTMSQALALVCDAVGGDLAKLDRLLKIAHEVGPTGVISVENDEEAK